MEENILIVTDNAQGRWAKHIPGMRTSASQRISILTLGITSEYFVRFSPIGRWSKTNCEFVDVAGMSESAQERAGSYYIDYIFELPRRVKEGLFFCNGKNLWWYLEMTERCSVRSKIINRLFYLALAESVVEQYPSLQIYIDIEDHLVAQAMIERWPGMVHVSVMHLASVIKARFERSAVYFLARYVLTSISVFARFVTRALALDLCRLKGFVPPGKGATCFLTNYPYWWSSPFNDQAHEKFLGTLPESLTNIKDVCYATWLFSLHPHTICMKKEYLRRFFTEKKMVLMERLLSFRDKAKILSVGYLRWALSVRRYFISSFKSTFGEYDISSLVHYEMARSLTHVELFDDILLEDAARVLIETYRPNSFIYRIEFQPFEKAVLTGIGKGCMTIAFQHSTFSKNRISHYFAKDEFAFHLAEDAAAARMPLPDMIFATGRYFKDIVVRAGYPSQRVEICGPVRYRGLLDYAGKSKDKNSVRRALGYSESDKIFLVALNWVKEEVLALVSSLIDATRGFPHKLTCIFRSHPNKNYDRLIDTFLKNERPDFTYRFLNDEYSLYDGIFISDGVIQVATTIGYEAMVIGRMPIAYENRHVFNINSTEELKTRVPVTHTPESLREAIASVIASDKAIGDMMSRWPETFEMFFSDLKRDPYERFASALGRYTGRDAALQ